MSELTPLSLDDYEAIADAVQETERGRWFLAEFARRNRTSDTAQVLEALAGLERRLASGPNFRRASSLVEQALRSARLARTDATGARLERLDGLVRDLGLALEALGPDRGSNTDETRPQDDGSRQEPAPPPPLALAPPPELVEVDWVDLDQFEDQLLHDAEDDKDLTGVVAASPDEDSVASHDRSRHDDPGHPRFVAGSGAAAVNGEHLVVSPSPPARLKLPTADTPRLLERLTDVEKSILFA